MNSKNQRKLACDQKRAPKNETGVNKEGNSNCNADKKRMRWIRCLPVSKERMRILTVNVEEAYEILLEHPTTKSSAARVKALERSWVGC